MNDVPSEGSTEVSSATPDPNSWLRGLPRRRKVGNARLFGTAGTGGTDLAGSSSSSSSSTSSGTDDGNANTGDAIADDRGGAG